MDRISETLGCHASLYSIVDTLQYRSDAVSRLLQADESGENLSIEDLDDCDVIDFFARPILESVLTMHRMEKTLHDGKEWNIKTQHQGKMVPQTLTTIRDNIRDYIIQILDFYPKSLLPSVLSAANEIKGKIDESQEKQIMQEILALRHEALQSTSDVEGVAAGSQQPDLTSDHAST